MIVRLWRGRTTAANAGACHRHIAERVFPSIAGINGHRGAFLLRRDTEGHVEFLAATLWDSLAAIRDGVTRHRRAALKH
jgi:heme-degrading monooxygenase HmoA